MKLLLHSCRQQESHVICICPERQRLSFACDDERHVLGSRVAVPARYLMAQVEPVFWTGFLLMMFRRRAIAA